jgi:hypothetical protein
MSTKLLRTLPTIRRHAIRPKLNALQRPVIIIRQPFLRPKNDYYGAFGEIFRDFDEIHHNLAKIHYELKSASTILDKMTILNKIFEYQMPIRLEMLDNNHNFYRELWAVQNRTDKSAREFNAALDRLDKTFSDNLRRFQQEQD